MKNQFSFSLDFDTDVEWVEVLDGDITEDQCVTVINDLKSLNLLYLSEHRTEGEVTINSKGIKVYERHYTGPDWGLFNDRTFTVDQPLGMVSLDMMWDNYVSSHMVEGGRLMKWIVDKLTDEDISTELSMKTKLFTLMCKYMVNSMDEDLEYVWEDYIGYSFTKEDIPNSFDTFVKYLDESYEYEVLKEMLG